MANEKEKTGAGTASAAPPPAQAAPPSATPPAATSPSAARPAAAPLVLIAIIEHDQEHAKTDPQNPAFRSTWLAFNPTTRRVMVEVEADAPAGLKLFRDHYRLGRPDARGEERADHALPGDPKDWTSLIGEREAGDDPADPNKHVKRAARLRGRFAREAEERERRERDARGEGQGPKN